MIDKQTMERESLGSFFKRTLKTINGLEDDEFEVYKRECFMHHDGLARRHFGALERFRLRQGKFARMLFGHEAVQLEPGVEWVATRMSYGRDADLLVPRNFYILTEAVLSLDCRVSGIFRVRNSMITVKECVNTLNKCVKRSMSYEEARDLLVGKFNVIDLTTAFKEIIREYSTTIIPDNLIDVMFKISKVCCKKEQIALCQMLFISMPKPNRHILEATIYFLYVIHDIATDKGTNYRDNMNMEGISTIMMPNLILKPHNELDLEQVGVLVNFMKVFFENFRAIIQVDENVLSF